MSKYILLLNKKQKFLVKKGCIVHTHVGTIDTKDLAIGQKVCIRGEEFVIVEPTIIDFLGKCKRTAQIVMPEDASQIIAVTGLGKGWRCVDAGSGSGFLAIFLAYTVGSKGKVYTYEKREDFYEIVKYNVEKCGFEEIVVPINDKVENCEEHDIDLITLDMRGAENVISALKKCIKSGGWMVVYSPHIEQQIKVRKEMNKVGFVWIKTMETIQREWKSLGGYTHPKPKGIIHTGFMTFGRKIT
jgi:tRNA (adenine57-N1/adenine58-N1)-methyltransferase